MSFDQNKKDTIEMDDLNIKLHLNKSLDISKISVSEDLIRRTLEAIKSKSPEQSINVQPVQISEQKVIPWARYIRTFAAVAAAGLILVVGVKSINLLGGTKDDISSDSRKNSVAYDMKSESKADSASQTSDASDFDENIRKYTTNNEEASPLVDSDSQIMKEDVGVMEQDAFDSELSFGVTMPGTAPADNSYYSDIYTLSFGDICPIVNLAAESVNITDSATGDSVFLSSEEDINTFYTMLDRYAYSEGADSSGVNNYVIKISSSGSSYTIAAEDEYIITNYSYGDEKTDSRYIAAEYKQLLLDIQALYQRYSQ
ncbi:MAG TPA: hypothetical protein VJ888_03870 [Mobilitalea sp.]|nr:hypothetical protein [Mobilitalea sp.]